MKKIFLALFAITAFIARSNAQIGFAPEAGLNLSTVHVRSDGDKVDDYRLRPGLRIGAVLDLPVIGGLSIQPGLFYSMKGTNYRHSNTVLGVTTKTEINGSLNYLEVPINVVYKFGEYKDGFFVFAGPYIGYALDGRSKTTTTVGNYSTERKDDVQFGDDDGETKRLDVGGNIGLGYMLPMGLYFRAQYNQGFVNLVQGGDRDNSIRNANLAFTLGIMIGGD